MEDYSNAFAGLNQAQVQTGQWASAQPVSTTRLEVYGNDLFLGGVPIQPKYGRRGVQIGCHFVTYDALDKIYRDSQQ